LLSFRLISCCCNFFIFHGTTKSKEVMSGF
jgi:hypothetical protein